MTDYRNKFTNSGQKITLTDSLRKEELFDTSGNKIIQSISDNSYLGEAESERFIKSYIKQRSRYIPKLDYSDPSSFCFYGSSERYYKDSIDRVYNTYPYDGSKAEKMEWSLTASYLDLYMLEHEYPKAKGHVAFSNGGWGTRAAVEGAYGLSSAPEYIYFVGGPHSGTMFNSSKKRESNLKIDGSTGNTAEFWLKKQSFVGSSLTTREVIFDTHTSGAITGTSTHGRFTVLLDSSVGSGSPFKLTYLSGTAGITDQVLGTTAVTKATVADNAWHHYAVTVVHSGSNIVSKLYVDGALEDTNTASVASFGAVDRNFVGTIGALATGSSGGTDAKIGYGKLSGSLDEFRYWKTARTEKQIGRYFYRPVHGGTDKDNNNPELGLYYKFNEGIIGVQSYDEVVLDYSGRIGNGKVIGWSDTFRSSLSGIESSTNLPEASYSEPGDPIINGKNPLVQDLLTKFKNFGKSHDIQNGSSLANTVPSYFMQEDKTGLMGELVQIIAATLDDIFLKIKFLPNIKDYNYRDFFDQKGVQQSSDTNNFLLGCEDSTDYKFTGNHSKPWVNYILEHFGLATTEIFPNADLIETFLQKSDKLTFEQNLHEVKNAILSNIHSNLIHIYNTKGTEKSFRNLIRCFGVDDELIKLNVYGNNESYKLEKKPIYTTVKQKSLNFANANYQGTLYQTASNKLYMEQRYITSSTEPKPLTLEASIVFPDNNSITTNLQTASLFGMHSVQGASGSGDALTWHPLDSGSMQAYFVRRSNFAGDGYFLLTSSAGAFTAVSSSYMPGVYDNTHWNISVRVAKKGDIDFGLTRLSGSTGYKVEFTGYNYDLDVLKNSFYVTSSITRTGYEMMSSLDRAVYAGSHKTNFTGSHLHSSDVRLLGFNVHLDGLTNDELKEHAKNPAVFGRTDPQHVSNFDDGSNLRATDTTVLRWQFENLLSSSAGGTLSVLDFTSGSIETPSGSLVGYKYPGAASGFAATGSAIVQEFIPSVEYAPIDNVYSSDRVQIKSTEVEKFTAGSRPVTYFYSFEKSMYQVISKEMINMFAGITGMSNLIGEPVNKYRQEYKMMEKMREKFFRNVENDMDLDKFVEYYKWIDSSLSHFIQQLVPASSNFSGRIREIVESHALERNKYKHQAPTVEYKDPTVSPTNILGVNELLYDWEHGHAPLQTSRLTNEKAIQFSSPGDAVSIPDADAFSVGDASSDSPFSFSAWVYIGDVTTDSGVFTSKRDLIAGTAEYFFGHNLGNIEVYLYDGHSTSNRLKYNSTGKLSSATWHHVIITYDGSSDHTGINVYVDGAPFAGTKALQGSYTASHASATDVYIGATKTPTSNAFEDFIADVVFYNKELSATEVTEIRNGGKVYDMNLFSAYSNIIAWYKMGDDLDTTGAGGIKDYKGTNHGTMLGSTAIVASTGLGSDREVTDPKETTNCLWQKDRSERSSDRETIRRVAVTDVSGSTYVLRKLSRPYRFSAEQSKPIGTGFNRKTNKNPELYKMATRAGKVELAAVTEEPVCKDVIDPNFTEYYRGSTNNINDDSYLDADSDLLFPFTMISSSVGVDLEQVKENLQIANNHLDIGLTGEQSLQSPFTRQHVGGMPHRKVEMGLTGSAVRPEAYNLTASNSTMVLTTASIDSPKSMFYRDGGAGAPYMFKNVKHGTGSNILGNYNKDYEIVQTSGRSLNNNLMVDNNGDYFSTSTQNVNFNQKSIDTNGTGRIVVSDNDSLTFTSGSGDRQFSISSWVYLSSTSAQVLLAKRDDDGLSPREYRLYQASGRIFFQVLEDGTTHGYSVRSNVISTGAWYHIAATYNGNESSPDMELYINGSSNNSLEQDVGYDGMSNTSADLIIGGEFDGATFQFPWLGEMADIVIFNKQLTTSQVTELYGSGKIIDIASYSQYSRVVSWWKMGDDLDVAAGSNAIRDYVGSNHGSASHGLTINTPTGLGSVTTPVYNRRVNASTAVSGVIDFRKLTGSTTKHIIANRFSAPGGPETAGAFANNYESNEYSIYNTLNYRNSTVRSLMNRLHREHATREGMRGSIESALATASVSFPGTAFSTSPPANPWFNLPAVDQQYVIISSDGTSKTYIAKDTENLSSNHFHRDPGPNMQQSTFQAIAQSFANAVNHSSGHAGKILATVGGTYGTTVTLKQLQEGESGNTTIAESGGAQWKTASIEQFTGGRGSKIDNLASVHMVNRNPIRRTGSTAQVKYNSFNFQTPIPQSDYQYSWITGAVNDNVYDFLSRNDNFSYVHNFKLSSSAVSPDNISANQIGFVTSSREKIFAQYQDIDILPIRFTPMITGSNTGYGFSSQFQTIYSGPSLQSADTTNFNFGNGSSADDPFTVSIWLRGFTLAEQASLFPRTSVAWPEDAGYIEAFSFRTADVHGPACSEIFGKDLVWALYLGQPKLRQAAPSFSFVWGADANNASETGTLQHQESIYTRMDTAQTADLYNSGEWFNITVTYDGLGNPFSSLNMYVNGKAVNQTRSPGAKWPGYNKQSTANSPLVIGNNDRLQKSQAAATSTYAQVGWFGDLAAPSIFSKKLTDIEVEELYRTAMSPHSVYTQWPAYPSLSFYSDASFFLPTPTPLESARYSLSGTISGTGQTVTEDTNGPKDIVSNTVMSTFIHGGQLPTYSDRGSYDWWDDDKIWPKFHPQKITLKNPKPKGTVDASSNFLSANLTGPLGAAELEHRLSKFSYSTWKQLRGSEHPITRAHRKDNTISIAVRGSEVMPSVHDEYLFDFNKDLQNISGIDKKTVDRTFVNYTEPMVTNRFNPMTITLHNEQVGGLSLESIRLMQEETYLSQREEENVWNLDEGLITAMVTSDTGPDGITRRPVDNRLLVLRKTYQNDLTSFANANITDKLEIDDFKRHTFNDLLLSYQREFSTDEGTTMELNYVETIYPREENTYTKNARLRENFHFFGWNSSRTSRSIILTGSNAYNSSLVTAGTSNLFPEITVDKDDYQRTNPFFVDAVGSNSSVNPTRFTHVRASTWPLDARETFSRAPLSITSSFFNEGKDFLPFRKQGQFGEGVLQNDYSIFGLGVNTVHGTPPPAPIYSRRIPQTYSGNTFLAGEAKWEAAEQSGQVPFVDSYEEYREKIRTLGQDHSIVPEFRISEFIEDTIKNNDGNFLASTSISENFLSLTGAIYNQSSGDLEVGSSFFKTYATSDFMKYFNPIVEQTDIEGFKNDVDPMRLTLKCQAAMKFVPYRGFYPAERVLQIAELFGRGYMSDFSFTNTQQDTRISQTNSGVRNLLERKIRANLQQSIKPLMAPGILFNSIKSGMAVDYPLFGSDADASTISSFGTLIDRTTHLTGGYGGTLKALTMYTGSLVNQSTTYTGSVIPSSIPRLSGSVYKRVTFEDLLEPDRLRGTLILDNEPHPSASIHYGNSELGRVMDYPFKFGQLDTTRTEQKLNADSFSLKKPLSETLVPYKMAINNFCAETVNFFLEDGSSATLESDEVEVRLAASTAYKMRVYVRNKDLTMYDRHSAFGPPVDEGRSVTKAKFKSQQIIVSGSGARKDMGFLVRNYDLASGSSNIPLDNSLPGIVMTGSGGNKVAIKFVTASVPNTTNITNNPGNGTTAEGTFNATGLGNIYLKGTSSYIDVNSIKTNFADPFGVKYDQDTNQYIDYNRSSALAQLIRYGVNVIAHNSSSGIVADVTLKQVTDKNLFPADVPSGATYLRYNLEFVQTANATASAGVSWRNIKENSTGSATIPQSRAEHWFETYPVSGSRNFIGGAADNPVTKLTHKVNVTDHDGHGYAPYHPPFLDKNAEPYVEISFTPSSAGTYTLDQIWEGATFTYNNFYQEPSNANTATTKRNNTNFNHAMAISASIDLKSFVQYQAEENAPGSNRDGRKRWVIQSKWETPVLQFSNVTASALKLSDSTVANVTNSPWQNRTWTQYFSQSLATSEPYLTASTGMWHQYGALPAKVGEGYELAVEEIEGLDSSKQLARLVGFTSENKRSAKATPGRISEFKEIAESVVAIPYYVTDDDQVEFFDISEEIMLKARTLNEGRKRQLGNGTLTSEEYDKLFNTPGSNPTLLAAYQMRMMEKYVMPPQFDFVTYPKLAKTSRPMMYVFQFRAAMKKQDLQNIWQNLSPTSAVSTGKARYSATRANETKFGLESDVQYVSHFLDVDKTPFEGSDQKAFLNEKVRWIVFKVKMRAEKDLSKVKRESLPGLKSGKKIANTSIKDSGYFYKDDSNDPVINESRGINGLKYKHSFNWPYDYFSMVELIKVESKVDFLPKPPNQRN